MSFRKFRGIRLPYREQGMIYFTCQNFDKQPRDLQERIRALCREVGGQYHEGLFAFLTREVSMQWVERHYFLSPSLLSRKKVQFYERWPSYIGDLRKYGRQEGAQDGEDRDM